MLQSVLVPRRAGASPLNAAPDVFVNEYRSDATRVAVLSTSVHLVVRFGPHVPGGCDVHALGPRHKVHRKLIRGGQSAVFARLPWHTYQAALGTSAAEVAGRIVSLRDLWGTSATQRLEEQLVAATDADAAALILKTAIAGRLGPGMHVATNMQLVQRAARQLESRNVAAVAEDLRISERHLRRVFHELVGLSPKAFCKLMRFERAVEAAIHSRDSSWSDIAVAAGYYDQAHLIADFRFIAGATPREFLAELHASESFIRS